MSAITFPGIDPTAVLDGSPWNRFGADEPEYEACESRLRMLDGDPTRSAWCVVLHGETGETEHCAPVNGHNKFWSDRDAELADAWYGILPTCTNCKARYRKTDGSQYCGARCQLADKHNPADDYELDEVA